MAVAKFLFITIDAQDAERTAAFWAEILGTSVGDRMDDGRFVFLEANDELPVVCIQRVPEAKSVKNRVHLDLSVDDLQRATERILELGGSWDGTERALDTFRWRTVRDPDGNEFDIATETA